jgi:putative membrane protein
MFNYIIKLGITAAAVWFGSKNIKGISVDAPQTAVIVALVLGLLNTFVKPILKILSFPITLITLGLFLLVINVGIIYLGAYFIKGFKVEGFIAPLIFSFGLSLVSTIAGFLLD